MARYSGRNMGVYISLDGTAAASPLPFIAEYDISSASDQIEVTAGGDTNKTYVVGLPDFSGSISGFYDNTNTQATSALYKASRDGVARGFYLYTDTSNPNTTPVFYGTAFFDFNIKAGVGSATAVSSKISAAGNIYMKP